jgi:hypothetical protein
MQILHVFDQAGVAAVIAKYQSLQGHDSKVVTIDGIDKYGIDKFYQDYVCCVLPAEFEDECIRRGKHADIIHIHSMIHTLIKLRKKFGRSKKMILHYHGTDIRGLNTADEGTSSECRSFLSILFKVRRKARKILRNRTHRKAQRLADAVIVATPDLLHCVPKSTLIANPVDLEHFRPDEFRQIKKEALTLKTEITNAQWTLDYCKNNNISVNIEVYDRTKKPIMYADMPSFLKDYEFYVDIKYVNTKVLESLSKTGLEALACGLTVINYELNYQQGLPPEHDPKNIVLHLVDIYSRNRNRLFSIKPSVTCILLDLIYDIYETMKLFKIRINERMIVDH